MESLAVRYRPSNFSEVVGQDMVVSILKKQVELKEFKNCYLFCGASGCGKTTVARIFAKSINDMMGAPIEIDGASNNGVDNVRSLVSHAYERSIDSKYKIYIVDECHAITVQGWQAFLKCIEEPPEYTIFIFCTTDPQKVPATILNRCQRFNFLKLDPEVIKNRLKIICDKEGVSNYLDSIDFISKNSNGQLRDAISNLEKVIDYDSNLAVEKTISVLGKVSYAKLFELLDAMIDGREDTVLSVLDNLYKSTTDWKYFSDNLLGFMLDVYKYCLLKSTKCVSIPDTYESNLISVTNFSDANKYYAYVMSKLISLKEMIKTDNYPFYSVQTILLQITRCE